MLSVPWPLRRAVVSIASTPEYVEAISTDDVDHHLERAKERVGVFRFKHGDERWKERVASVDRPMQFANTIERPVSRAYFKLIEIIRTCALGTPETTLHICEAPGGFAQAVLSEFPTTRTVYVMSRARGGPLFSTVVLHDARVEELDVDGDSNVLRAQVRDDIVARARDVDLVTADGAIDNEERPELTEDATARLIACEIDAALRVQREGGTFVLKIFGFMRRITRQLIALLTTCYETVYILKPHTSRSVNDERYIVCTNFEKARAPRLVLPDSVGGFLWGIADVDQEWMDDAQTIALTLSATQRIAIEQALTSTLSSGRSMHRHGRGQRPQTRGRGHPFRARGRGPPPNRTF